MGISEIEFLVDSVTIENGRCYVKGACNKGPIKTGDRFFKVFRIIMRPNGLGGFENAGRANIRDIEVKVDEIVFYRNKIDELPVGMSADILLSGIGCDLILEKDALAVE